MLFRSQRQHGAEGADTARSLAQLANFYLHQGKAGDALPLIEEAAAIDQSRLGKLRNGDEVFSERASLIFKTTQVVRFWDARRRTLIYLSYTDRIIEGSPQNSISVVPVGLN